MGVDKTLIVVISDYPYRSGEPFFENEIIFLARSFKNIFVFSVMGKKSLKETRHYPPNVHCYPLGCGHSRIKCILKGFFSSHKYFPIKDDNIKKMLMNSYVYGRNVVIFNKIKKYIKDNNIDLNKCVLYSYWLTLAISIVKLGYFIESKHSYLPLMISRCHGYDVYSEANKYNYAPMQKESIKRLKYVFSCSEFGAIYLRKKYPEQSNKINTNRLGTRYHLDVEKDNNKKEKMFVTCSRFSPVKRLSLFAEGFSLACKYNEDIHWVCIGNGKEKDKIDSIINVNNIEDRVTFLGALLNEKVLDFYKNNYVYCFVNTSLSEGIPVSIMEAISYGIPVIATAVGGNSEIVDSSNGFLLKKECTKEDVCKAIINISNLKNNEYKELRRNSRIKWEKEYNSNDNYKKWVLFLSEERMQ